MRLAIVFFAVTATASQAAAQDCSNPAQTCRNELSRDCLSGLGAGVLSAEAPAVSGLSGECQLQLDRYRACLQTIAAQCGGEARPPTAASGCSAEDARQMFDSLQSSRDADELEAFADACPSAPQARLARVRARKLRNEPKKAAPVAPAAAAGSRLSEIQGEWRGDCDSPRASEFRARIEGGRIETLFTWKTGAAARYPHVPIKGSGEIDAALSASGRYWCAHEEPRGRCLSFKGGFVGAWPQLDFGVTRCALRR